MLTGRTPFNSKLHTTWSWLQRLKPLTLAPLKESALAVLFWPSLYFYKRRAYFHTLLLITLHNGRTKCGVWHLGLVECIANFTSISQGLRVNGINALSITVTFWISFYWGILKNNNFIIQKCSKLCDNLF